MERRWVFAQGRPEVAERLSRELGLHPVAARVLANRGFEDVAAASTFLDPKLADLPDPFLMKGMSAAVARIVRAIQTGESICCYGDYDVDGVTSTVLLVDFLRAAGAR